MRNAIFDPVFVKRKHTRPPARSESAHCVDQDSFTAHECLSAGGPCIPAGPDIHLLSQAQRAVTDD
jgi:hypothetical protein